MKKSLSVLLMAFFAFSCKPENLRVKSDLETSNLKGNVRKIEKTIHETGNTCGCVLKTDFNRSEYFYNEAGNLLRSYTIDENGSIYDSTKYVYNRYGLCSEIDRYRGEKSVGKEVPVLKKGKLTGYKIFNEDGSIEATLNYIYSGDEISEEKTLNPEGEVIATVKKEFSNGLLVTQTEMDQNGKVKTINKFIRNSDKDISECMILVSKDNKEFRLTYEYEYDSKGNWIRQTQLYNGDIITIIIRNIEYFKT
jgi:hypothetical protein